MARGSPPRSGTSFAVVRYSADGTLDTTCGGGDAKLTTDFGEQLRRRP